MISRALDVLFNFGCHFILNGWKQSSFFRRYATK